MKRIWTVLGLTAAALIVGQSGAWASTTEHHYKVVAWQMSSWTGDGPVWPQTYYGSADATTPDLEAVTLPDCGYFQVDVYRYDTYNQQKRVNALIVGGVLNGPNDPIREPLVTARLANQGASASPTPSPDPTPTPTPSPSPSQPTTVTVPAPDSTQACGDKVTTVSLPKVRGVEWTQRPRDGDIWLNPGESVTFIAVAKPGYVIDGQTRWSFVGGQVTDCEPTLPHTGAGLWAAFFGAALIGSGLVARRMGRKGAHQ